MRTNIAELRWLGVVWKNVWIERYEYQDDGSLAVQLIDGEEGLLSTVTTNLSYYGLYPEKGCFWIKDYSEHEGLGNALIKAGVVERTEPERKVAFGPYDATATQYRFTKEYA